MTADVSPTPPADPSVTCRWCGGVVPLRGGYLAPHRQAPAPDILAALGGTRPGAPCPLSLTVPWRAGRPDEATVRRHLQEHYSNEIRAAHFQVQAMGIFHGIVVASFETDEETGPVQWGYGFPADADGKHAGGVINPPAGGDDRAWAWLFRPFDLHTGEPRPWVDAAEDAEPRETLVLLDAAEVSP